MIPVNMWFKTGMSVASKNSPAILTAFGAIGVVGTAILTAKATFEAAEKISELTEERKRNAVGEIEFNPLTRAEKIKLVWPLYIGAVSSGVLSCGAIVMSHRISSRRAAMLAAAYALNQDKLEEYQDKVKEKFGVKKEKEARDALAQDKVNRDFDETEVLLDRHDNLVLVREDYTGRFFWSTVERIDRAVNEINAHIYKEGSARLSEFYDLVGLSHVSTSDYFGWIKEEPMAIDWSTCTTPDGTQAVHSFEYTPHPIQDPEREANRSFR